MTTTRLTGPDHLIVEAVTLTGAIGIWARFTGVQAETGLLATRRGALVGLFDGPEALAAVVELSELAP
jgi:hypothetical protein